MSLKETTVNIAKEMLSLEKKKIDSIYIQKEKMDDLVYDIASILDLKNKKDEIDIKRVNVKLLKDAILVKKLDAIDKMKENYENYKDYLNLVNENSLKDIINKIVSEEKSLQLIQEEIKEIKKYEFSDEELNELEDKESTDKELFSFISDIVKEELQEYSKEKKKEYIENKTGEEPQEKQPKIIKEIFSKKEIKSKIKEK